MSITTTDPAAATASSPKETGRRWFEEVWNQRRKDAVHQLLAPGSVGHMEGQREVVGAEAFLDFHENMLKALPDLRVEVRDVIADGDNVCVHWLAKATHTGAAFGLAASNRTLDFNGMSWFRVENGRIMEGWDCWNQDGLFARMSQPA